MSNKVLLTKEVYFSAAHKLNNYKGKCASLHGHTYKLQITVSGSIKQSGMVVDFNEIHKIIENTVTCKLDHSYLNDFFKQPTAENMVIWIWNQIANACKGLEITLEEIKLWETPTSFASYRGEKYG
ncbi:6-carboxytetrahydropterin synthase QueD [candidate division WWE3 bacterium CG08_land_8_20_14_0_20_43_13]|uniref:6-carboxy-5,6,7,8-tetrahydropterin synthase n=2 Tax=Bacteria candidate phyla TaxID=1783234 RepID=A0A2H0X802_UNCKA|nr:MAG: 6-carboxytetrahydropterin synthase QueD [candidate division WWE3 bacterium CG08_land_8_20_14_0_20_43_13]PJE73243.1 MAG: 6-carboxytetrahydropterin synthase QueD [Candidatus Tagabacteria bacterium CG10_big_fil_rev_8_21_14_0_10_40_13]